MTRVAALLIATALLAACGSQGNVFELEAGTCFDDSATGDITNVPIVDCAEPHDNEVYAVWRITNSELPSADVLDAGCIDRLDQLTPAGPFVGAGFGLITPSADSFADGDREVICVISFAEPREGSAFVELDPTA